MLYPSGATIYMAGRSEELMLEAISSIQQSFQPAPSTPSALKFLYVDLADLPSVKRAAEDFGRKEEKLHVLWNNAGIGGGYVGSTTAQGIEVNVGTNCVAPLLLTQLLLPQLRKAAEGASEGSVRVVWTSSAAADTHSVTGGVDFQAIEAGKTTDPMTDYAVSKVGNWFLSHCAAQEWASDNIASVVQNPGNLNTHAYRYQPAALMRVLRPLALYEPRYGAYTMLYSGLSGEVENGGFVWPWGRRARSVRADIHEAIEKGAAQRFWKWCEEKARPYA